jgi:hypothetical protein
MRRQITWRREREYASFLARSAGLLNLLSSHYSELAGAVEVGGSLSLVCDPLGEFCDLELLLDIAPESPDAPPAPSALREVPGAIRVLVETDADVSWHAGPAGEVAIVIGQVGIETVVFALSDKVAIGVDMRWQGDHPPELGRLALIRLRGVVEDPHGARQRAWLDAVYSRE